MNDHAMAETWQTAFGKEFGGMSQGDNKTGQKGTNAMFIMAHNEIRHVLATRHKFSYRNLVVDYRPQKEDPHCIHSRLAVITSHTHPAPSSEQWIWTRQNYIGIVSFTQKGQTYVFGYQKKLSHHPVSVF